MLHQTALIVLEYVPIQISLALVSGVPRLVNHRTSESLRIGVRVAFYVQAAMNGKSGIAFCSITEPNSIVALYSRYDCNVSRGRRRRCLGSDRREPTHSLPAWSLASNE